MSFSANDAPYTFVIGMVYGDPGFHVNQELAKKEAWSELATNGENLELDLDEKTGKIISKTDTYEAAKELGKKDLIVGYTHRYRYFFDGDIDMSIPIKYWVVSKSWLRLSQIHSKEITELLKNISNGVNLSACLNQALVNAGNNHLRWCCARMLKRPTNLADYDDDCFLPAAARQFVMNVLVNSKSKIEHTFSIFKAKCEHYLKNTSWRSDSLSHPNFQPKTLLTPIQPKKQWREDKPVDEDEPVNENRFIDVDDDFFN